MLGWYHERLLLLAMGLAFGTRSGAPQVRRKLPDEVGPIVTPFVVQATLTGEHD